MIQEGNVIKGAFWEEKEQALSISMPEFLTVIRVIPEKNEMIESEEIKKIGMEIAMEYEKTHGRMVEDVSKENLGFDIRSKGEEEIRYIEVKARTEEGDVALTPNEWFKANRKDVWDYLLPAIREACINALIHRDYIDSAEIQIKIYDDRIWFWNPGGLPEGITIDDLKKNTHQNQEISSLLWFFITQG